MKIDFLPAIRRALATPCAYDFLALYGRQAQPPGGGSRVAFARVLKLADMARTTGGLPNKEHLARRFNTCPKTIQRDLIFLRTALALDLVYQPRSWKYKLLNAGGKP